MPNNKPYGLKITDAGRSLIAAVAAGIHSSSLKFAKVWIGKGIWPDGTTLDQLGGVTELLEPVAEAVSTVPAYDGDTVSFKIQYRNDMNGGLEQGFWISEFPIFRIF